VAASGGSKTKPASAKERWQPSRRPPRPCRLRAAKRRSGAGANLYQIAIAKVIAGDERAELATARRETGSPGCDGLLADVSEVQCWGTRVAGAVGTHPKPVTLSSPISARTVTFRPACVACHRRRSSRPRRQLLLPISDCPWGNVTQSMLAWDSGIGLRILRRLKAGRPSTFDTFLRVAVALNLDGAILGATPRNGASSRSSPRPMGRSPSARSASARQSGRRPSPRR